MEPRNESSSTDHPFKIWHKKAPQPGRTSLKPDLKSLQMLRRVGQETRNKVGQQTHMVAGSPHTFIYLVYLSKLDAQMNINTVLCLDVCQK